MLEDEKAYRTCHIAIGKNYDEDANALIHLDGLITEPTITLTMENGSERVLMKRGDLLI
jgi:leucyl aminopeptidase (aminopeptidase T)